MKIVILSKKKKTYFNKRFIEVAAELYDSNIEVLLVDPQDCSVLMDEKESKLYFKGKPLENVDAVIPRIDYEGFEYSICVIKYFEKAMIPVINGAKAFLTCKNKFEMLQNLNRIDGVKVPKTVLLKDNSDLDYGIEIVGGFPAVIKTTLLGKDSLGAILINKSDYAEAFLDLDFIFSGFVRCDQSVMVQEFIKGAIGRTTNYLVLGKNVVDGFLSRRTLANNEFFNVLRNNVPNNVEISADIKQLVLDVAEIFGIDFGIIGVIDVNQGRYVFKVTPLVNVEDIEKNYGVDLMAKLLRHVIYEKVPQSLS